MATRRMAENRRFFIIVNIVTYVRKQFKIDVLEGFSMVSAAQVSI